MQGEFVVHVGEHYFDAPFWQGCREHRLLLPTCRACGKAHLPPRPVCPFCFAEEIAWQEASGHGHVSTWTKLHKAWFPAFAEETHYGLRPNAPYDDC